MNQSLPDATDIVVIGGGQAGLSMSWHLVDRGIPHVVVERHAPGHAWHRERWDSFCLVTPNWQCRLPGFPYAGSDPDGFMRRDEIVRYVSDYAGSFGAPLVTGVEVTGVRQVEGRFDVRTESGTIRAGCVVVATGGYHRPRLPAIAAELPPDIEQINPFRYRNPREIRDGGILVVGSGQSGAQIAEDLLLGGRDVHLAVGRAPRVSRFYRGRDVVAWLDLMKFYDLPVEQHPLGLGVRDNTNHYVTGRDGGRDIDLRAHAAAGMHLHGRMLSLDGNRLHFAPDLAGNLDRADAANEAIKRSIDRWIAENGVAAPAEAPYRPVWTPPADHDTVLDLEAARIRTVIWATGFAMDMSWIEGLPLDASGRPAHSRGVSPDMDGLMFLGLPWLHSWGSGRFSGVARDAAFLADRIVERSDRPRSGAPMRREAVSAARNAP